MILASVLKSWETSGQNVNRSTKPMEGADSVEVVLVDETGESVDGEGEAAVVSSIAFALEVIQCSSTHIHTLQLAAGCTEANVEMIRAAYSMISLWRVALNVVELNKPCFE